MLRSCKALHIDTCGFFADQGPFRPNATGAPTPSLSFLVLRLLSASPLPLRPAHASDAGFPGCTGAAPILPRSLRRESKPGHAMLPGGSQTAPEAAGPEGWVCPVRPARLPSPLVQAPACTWCFAVSSSGIRVQFHPWRGAQAESPEVWQLNPCPGSEVQSKVNAQQAEFRAVLRAQSTGQPSPRQVGRWAIAGPSTKFSQAQICKNCPTHGVLHCGPSSRASTPPAPPSRPGATGGTTT